MHATFNAVGAVREQFLASAACDVLILTAAQLDAMADELLPGSTAPLGAVHTAVAVPAGHAEPAIGTAAAFAAAMRDASAIYVPDPIKSTAGIHVMSVLVALGIDVSGRLRAFPNGETAMRALAAAALPGSIGSTQTTEINNTEGLTLVGRLPPGHGLATIYSAAVPARATAPDAARRLVALLTGPETLPIRQKSGFE